jgi:hypothetical protein
LNVEDDFEEAKRPLILAGYILSDDVKLEPGVENKLIDDLFDEYLNTDYEVLRNLVSNVIKELLSSEKEKLISGRIRELAISENVRAIYLLILIDLEEALPILSKHAKSKSVVVKRGVASAIMEISHSVGHNGKIVKILNTLIEEEDFITFFYLANAFRFLPTKEDFEKPQKTSANTTKVYKEESVTWSKSKSSKDISFPDKIKDSCNFRKYSLFSSLHGLSSIGLDELVKDNNHKIREIATQIKRHERGLSISLLSYPYPQAILLCKDISSFQLILAPKPNSDLAYFEISSMNTDVVKYTDLAYFEISSMNTDVVKYIRAVKNSNLPEDSKLLALGHSMKGNLGLCIGLKFSISDFEKIVNSFRNELDVLYSIKERLRYSFQQDRRSAHKFLKTDDSVIRLLISTILDEKPDEKTIKESLEIFREEKNDKNKRVLFLLLYPFLSPFSLDVSGYQRLQDESFLR